MIDPEWQTLVWVECSRNTPTWFVSECYGNRVMYRYLCCYLQPKPSILMIFTNLFWGRFFFFSARGSSVTYGGRDIPWELQRLRPRTLVRIWVLLVLGCKRRSVSLSSRRHTFPDSAAEVPSQKGRCTHVGGRGKCLLPDSPTTELKRDSSRPV